MGIGAQNDLGGDTKLLPEKRFDALNFARKLNRFFCRDRQI